MVVPMAVSLVALLVVCSAEKRVASMVVKKVVLLVVSMVVLLAASSVAWSAVNLENHLAES